MNTMHVKADRPLFGYLSRRGNVYKHAIFGVQIGGRLRCFYWPEVRITKGARDGEPSQTFTWATTKRPRGDGGISFVDADPSDPYA